MIKSRHIIFWSSEFKHKKHSANKITAGIFPEYCSGYFNQVDKLSRSRDLSLSFMGQVYFSKIKE